MSTKLPTKLLFYINILSLGFIITFFSTLGFYVLAEKVFFDRMFYQKSAVHGYRTDGGNAVQRYIENFLIADRLDDLLQLVYQKDSSNHQSDSLGTVRIAVIGDSVAYGLGVRKEDAFPLQLQAKLNAYRPTKVYNYSYPGDSIIDNFLKYQLSMKKDNIDLYIFTMIDNDLLFQKRNKYPGYTALMDQLKSDCKQSIFTYEFTGRTWEDLVNQGFYPSYSDRFANVCFLKQIATKIAPEKSLFISFDSTKSYHQGVNEQSDFTLKVDNLYATYASVLRDQGLRVIDPDDSTKKFIYHQVSAMEGHPSKETQGAYADILLEKLLTTPLYTQK